MVTIQFTGRITEDGKLEAVLLAGLPPGEVNITLEIAQTEPTWTEAELRELVSPMPPMTGKQIVEAGLLGGWQDEDIIDGATWVEEHRYGYSDQTQQKNKTRIDLVL